MAFRTRLFASAIAAAALFAIGTGGVCAQVFVVGEKTAMADVANDFHPTRVELPSTPITERGRRELIRNLEAEQGFAHRPLPLGQDVILMANGNMMPGGDAYKQLLYKKGQVASAGDRVAITTVTVKGDRIVFDVNGGPYLKHRIWRHIELNDAPVVADDGAQVTGCRITLVFEGGIPELSAPEVKALLDPIIDCGVKTSGEAYADSLPPFLKNAIAQHDVLVGMDRRMVLAAMGAPLAKERELMPGTSEHYEEWIFGQVPQTVRFVRFMGDRVTQVRIAALGQPIAVHDQDELHGYLDPQDMREIAMGDGKQGGGDSKASAPPTILKPGEIAPGSSQQVQLPVSAPTATPDKASPPSAVDMGDTPANTPPAASTKLASSTAQAPLRE